MKKIRIGNDFRFVWVIERNSQAEDLTLATNLVLTIKSMYGDSAIPFTLVDGNKVCVDVDSKNAGNVAKYNLRLTYTIPDDSLSDGFRDCSVDIDAFEIVAKTELAEKVDEFTSTSEIAIGFEGADAFEVWVKNGNEGKTYEEYITFLQKPANDAAVLADAATENANAAAILANTKAGLADAAAILATEKAALADSKATLANDKAVLAQSAADNANTKATEFTAAEGLRVTAETGRVTAETGRATAETGRTTAESARVSAETTRGANETGRQTAETARIGAESSRATAETGRTTAETARVTAENARVASGAELKTNMSTNIETDKASTTKYPQLKALYDWATGRFLTITQTVSQTIGTTGARLTKIWVTDIESTNMPTVGGVSLSTTFASKSSVTDYIALYSRKIATVINGVITAIQDTWDAHNSRVVADSATVKNLDFVKRYYQMCYDNNMFDSIKFAWLGAGGSKFRTSGIYSYFTKIYSLLGGNDAIQTTSTNQPYLTGNIAPNEKLGLKNPNGGSNFMTHPTISFGATDAWSVTTVLNWNGGNSAAMIIGDSTNYRFFISSANLYRFELYNGINNQEPFISTVPLIGKNDILTIVSSGTFLKIYINGIYINQLNNSNNNSFIFDNITEHYQISASIHAHIIRSQALTQAQVTAEYNLLRSYIPEIENVTIGTQTWATSNCEMAATPQGNVIAEMQTNVNVEKITNIADREFSSDTGWWTKQSGLVINSGTLNYTANTQNLYRDNLLSVGKWYKLSYEITTNSGSIYTDCIAALLPSVIGTNIIYFKSLTSYFNIISTINTTDLKIDNISVQEIGWSGSQELYDGIYAQTEGTVEQKTYAAVKAAAMWCHYDNDVALGAVYGKLYNWFAVKLLQMDIDYYNAANPTTPWGWRVPAQADFQTLSTYLGGDDVSGGKLKKEGTTYWNAPNTGADNSSGFSGISGGFRYEDGVFQSNYSSFATTSIASATHFTLRQLIYNSAAFDIYYLLNSRGVSLRLIKN